MTSEPIRLGILGAARIAPRGVIIPARTVPGITVTAVASRDRTRAERFASKHTISRVHRSYADLLADPDVDAVYNPLPNGLHGRWTIAALEAGKHVLCEKPFTANADEARAVAAVARASGKVVMEAFHYRYHPLSQQVVDVVRSGELGAVRHIETSMCVPYLKRKDIRFDPLLAGGSVMDVGCYTIHFLRSLAGTEPAVRSARARVAPDDIDTWLQADFSLPDGATGRITCALLSKTLRIGARVTGERGEVRVLNPWAPQYLGRATVRTDAGRRRLRTSRTPTYTYQLQAFVDAVAEGKEPKLGLDDAIANMQVIDDVYRAVGLEPRRPTGS